MTETTTKDSDIILAVRSICEAIEDAESEARRCENTGPGQVLSAIRLMVMDAWIGLIDKEWLLISYQVRRPDSIG